MKTWITPEELTMYRLRGYVITITLESGVDGTRSLFECTFDGMLHREEGPAAIWSDGGLWWYHHGKIHRPDGPALVHPGGALEWWVNGKLHREDGPAYIHPAKTSWYQNGRIHREDGPAVVRSNGFLEWWVNGRKCKSERSWKIILTKLRKQRGY